MTSKAKMTAGKIISLAVVLLLIIASVGFAAYFSNGFTSEFKTFYVECNGEKILNDKDYYEMSANEEYRFDVKYLFDVGSKENKLGYHLSFVKTSLKSFIKSIEDKNIIVSQKETTSRKRYSI